VADKIKVHVGLLYSLSTVAYSTESNNNIQQMSLYEEQNIIDFCLSIVRLQIVLQAVNYHSLSCAQAQLISLPGVHTERSSLQIYVKVPTKDVIKCCASLYFSRRNSSSNRTSFQKESLILY